ncbi:MAG: site-specific DNA-methyltransferase [Candidatus Peribacteria bacterium]|nr:MAG: site-specific DNA-methyltransferase [Candidatus Peribacteria bacterium]
MEQIHLRKLILKVLKADERLWNEDKTELNQTLLLDLVENIDEKVIDLLLQEKDLREKFFVKIRDVYVFKTNDFRFFMEENKVDNSYTAYKNRIGLTDGKKFLKDTNDVVLDFPYKDCVLEGGQSTEEGTDTYFEYDEKADEYEKKQGKRKEIFFNSVLAHDEIDRLFDHKALTNWKRFTKDGEQEVKEIKRDEDGTIKENLIIKGNNLLALYSLKKQFAGKVKLIYIDPPYNTGNDGFKYNDNFNHSTWLTFMKNRLEVAKELLRDDGVIFISCDHNEQSYLKVLLDGDKNKLFGRENYIATLSVENNPKGRKNSNYVSISNEFCLIYAKNVNNQNSYFRENLPKEQSSIKYDDNGRAYTSGKRVLVGESTNNIVQDFNSRKHYSVYYHEKDNKIIIKNEKNIIDEDKELITKGFVRYVSIKDNNFIENTYTSSEFEKLFENNALIFKEKTIYEKDFNQYIRIKSLLTNDKLNNIDLKTETASKDLNDFGLDFSNPKNIQFIKLLLTLSPNKDDIILDFHAGSGTTAHAVLELNKEDGGNRKFIMIEQMDYINTVTCPRVQKVMEKENIDDSFIYFELAKWNETAKEKILACESLEELIKFFDEMVEKYFLNYNLRIKEFREKVIFEEEFKNLSLDEQKKMFVAMLDNNQMYVNKTEMADKKFGIDKEDQNLTSQFYNSEK